MGVTVRDERRARLATALAAVRTRIERACHRCGRASSEVTLIAVTKNFPASDVALLAELGVHDVGESRDQEARAKARLVPGMRWHFVGQLQRNKCRSVARYAWLCTAWTGSSWFARLLLPARREITVRRLHAGQYRCGIRMLLTAMWTDGMHHAPSVIEGAPLRRI